MARHGKLATTYLDLLKETSLPSMRTKISLLATYALGAGTVVLFATPLGWSIIVASAIAGGITASLTTGAVEYV